LPLFVPNKPDTLLLYLELGAAVSPHKYFREWKVMMINLALTHQQHKNKTQSNPAHPTQQTQALHTNQILTKLCSCKLSPSLQGQPLSNTSQGNPGKLDTSDVLKDDKTKLSDHQIAALMCYCGVKNHQDIPIVWKK
jgi:hypothetical protein